MTKARFALLILIMVLLVNIGVQAQLNCSGGTCPAPAGTIALPGLPIGTQPNGIYSPGSGAVGFTDGTSNYLSMSSTAGFMTSGWILAWTNSSSSGWAGSRDTGMSRISAAVVGIGNGQAADFSGTLKLAGIVGTSTNDSAAAGNIGQYLSSTVGTGASVTLASGSATPITSISLTAGDWDVNGVVDYTPNAATSITLLAQGSQALNNCMTAGPALSSQDTFSQWETAANIIGASDPAWVIPPTRISIATTTTICLISKATFSINSLKAYGTIWARRMR